ncbi:MFS transporter [Streptomyces sp. SP18CS02]|uniref:MFS transporter n=1 Tax=Streptomyces sp. SP18CS02 TaxID=3002531 RepID=UPI002E768839|nr:MFS transporter [Streptomyces sp. SP18CS02]MEE1754450.1 MFS transporter [Streptomyces sp. SP18CS02]
MTHLHRNARYCIYTEPFWAVFGTAALYYATLYMESVGLSTVAIGGILSANLYVAFLFQLVAGAVTDRMGRRRATFWFDVTSWVVPMFVWAFSDNFSFFLLGYLLNASSKIVNVSFWLLATEDSPEEHRPRIFAAIKLVIMFAGLLVPFVGFAMDRYGTVPSLRVLFFVGGLAMLLHNCLRHWYTVETQAGVAAMERHVGTPLLRSVIDSGKLLWAAGRHTALRRLVLMYMLSFVAFQLNVFLAVYLMKSLEYSALAVGGVPAVGAVVALLSYAVVMPWASGRVSAHTMARWSLVASSTGWLLFLALGPGNLALLFLCAVLTSGGPFLVESYRDALVVSCVHTSERATFFAAVQTFTAVVSIPTGYLSAVLFEARPLLLFAAIATLYAMAALCAFGRRATFQADVRLVPQRNGPDLVATP